MSMAAVCVLLQDEVKLEENRAQLEKQNDALEAEAGQLVQESGRRARVRKARAKKRQKANLDLAIAELLRLEKWRRDRSFEDQTQRQAMVGFLKVYGILWESP